MKTKVLVELDQDQMELLEQLNEDLPIRSFRVDFDNRPEASAAYMLLYLVENVVPDLLAESDEEDEDDVDDNGEEDEDEEDE